MLSSLGKRAHDLDKAKREARLEKRGQTEKVGVHPWRFKVCCIFLFELFVSIFSSITYIWLLSLPIEGIKRKIIRNLRVLENQGLVTTKNNYQDIVNAIARV